MTPETGEIILGDHRIAFTVARSRRRKRTIGFVMEGPETLRVLAPMRASLNSIQSVLGKSRGWIVRRLAEFERQKFVPAQRSYADGAVVSYLGHSCRLQITLDVAKPQGCELRPHRMAINLHNDRLNARDLSEEIKLELRLWLKKRAKVKFKQRMDLWAAHIGVRYQKLMIADAERRWGSCTAKNTVRLNWRLIMAPLPLLDYVVVHELCHIPHKNHGPRFWRQVADAMPDYAAHRKQLRSIGDALVL